jgi:hypothetical protein
LPRYAIIRFRHEELIGLFLKKTMGPALSMKAHNGLSVHLQNPRRVRYKPRASVSDTPGGEDATNP